MYTYTCFCMCTHTQSSVRIQLGCACRPYVCVRILMPRNPNPNIFASVSLFCFFNMPLSALVFYVYESLPLCFVVVCSSHVRLEFLFYSLFDMP